MVKCLVPIPKDVRPASVKCASTPQIIWNSVPENIYPYSGIVNSIFNPMVIREAANDLLNNPNYPLVLSGVDHLSLLTIHGHGHKLSH
ncbi:hypothetical protein SBA5_360015 [Candidatus Sulfotelmatomonas gaucii]|uniref:Uncharacterized protein n=1 Tax=Candidatus Sulfuritelmatomonas gaucii TaxID=2043161 RepID=A0A2N9LHM1_9BACT|nr:hypothetical protein SBA5_360015 [Candidatus Sulfotelmatomonas gaucii]